MADLPALSGPRGRAILYGGGGALGHAVRLVLIPAELLFRVASRAYHGAYDRGLLPAVSVAVPVISVGNLTVGGAGKTPFVRWLIDELVAHGRRPAVLHGGYADDEPALHRLWHPSTPVHADRNRVGAAGRAIAAGADALVLDDAFQHRRIARDLDIVLVAAERWLPRPPLLPRGPWREPPVALRRADVLVITRKVVGPDAAERAEVGARRWFDGLIARAWLRPAGWSRPGKAMAGPGGTAAPDDALLVAGIAEPEAFLANARSAGARIADVALFADHHAYTREDAEALRTRAAARPVVTTAKDAIRLQRVAPDLDLRVLEQELVLEQGLDALRAAIRRAFER